MAFQKLTRRLLNFASFNVGAFLGAQTSVRVTCHRNPYPMPHQFAAALDHPLRMAYRNPADTLGEFGIAAGMTVLDLGCGSGLFTLEMARRVGDTGHVQAVDIQQPFIEQTRTRLQEAGLSDRVTLHCCGAYDLPLPDDSVDLALLVATLGEIPDRPRALAEVRRVLKPNGRLALSEEMADPAYLPPFVVSRLVEDAGFRYGGRSGTWFCYNLIYFRNAGTVATAAAPRGDRVDADGSA